MSGFLLFLDTAVFWTNGQFYQRIFPRSVGACEIKLIGYDYWQHINRPLSRKHFTGFYIIGVDTTPLVLIQNVTDSSREGKLIFGLHPIETSFLFEEEVDGGYRRNKIKITVINMIHVYCGLFIDGWFTKCHNIVWYQ